MFWPIFDFICSIFCKLIKRRGDCNPISYDYETANHLSTGVPVCKVKLCQQLQSAFAATLYRRPMRTKRKTLTAQQQSSQDFIITASRWTFWKLSTTNIEMQTNHPWRTNSSMRRCDFIWKYSTFQTCCNFACGWNIEICVKQYCNTTFPFSRGTYCCSWLHRLELLRQAQASDSNSGH